jgi:hypothetical protein
MALQTASATAAARLQPLPKPYDTPPAAEALRPGAATLNLVKSQVDALLAASPSYHALARSDQDRLRSNLVKIAAYSAELIRDDWYQSQRLGQTPMLRRREVLEGPLKIGRTETNGLAGAQAAADDFRPAAASQIGRITRETLNAVAFPTFVADLIHSTFNAITQSSIQQIEAYVRLLDNVSRTVDQFMNNSVSDAQAHAWLAEMYPNHIRLDGGRAVPQPNADERPMPDFRRDLNIGGDVSLDESSIEETLVPAARRKLAQSRLQSLSTLVLMGMNRIIVTGGKIRATMGFHIDTTDRAHAESASELDLRHSAQFQIGFGWWGASASHSIAYVSSTRANSDAEINVDTDLTGEVEIHFKTESFPIRRFADAGAINQIRSNTAVPEENAVAGEPASSNPLGGAPAAGGTVGKYQSPRSRRSQPQQPSYRPIGTLPEARRPVAPDQVQGDLLSPERRFGAQPSQEPVSGGGEAAAPATGDASGQPQPNAPATGDASGQPQPNAPATGGASGQQQPNAPATNNASNQPAQPDAQGGAHSGTSEGEDH